MEIDPLHPPDLATLVDWSLAGAKISREDWEARQEDGAPPMTDVHVMIANVVELLRRHGVLVAELALVAPTRDELRATFRDATERLPALLESRIYNVELTPTAFMHSIGGLLAEHREAILRLVREQVVRPDVVEAPLLEAQIPKLDEDIGFPDLVNSICAALLVHSKALKLIAVDIDMRIEAS